MILLVLAGAGLVGTFYRLQLRQGRQPKTPPDARQLSIALMTNPVSRIPPANGKNAPVQTEGGLPNYADFQARPFPVGHQSSFAQWALADGKDTNVIRRLAHNRLEYDRMVGENSRIFKRQLVYLKLTVAALFEDAKLTGRPLRELILPGVDGQELQFEIVKSQSDDGSSRQGMFSGHLAGNSDSVVTLAFMDGREAFTVMSPKDGIFLVGEPREDGQVIVKAIDPNTYDIGPDQNAADRVESNR